MAIETDPNQCSFCGGAADAHGEPFTAVVGEVERPVCQKCERETDPDAPTAAGVIDDMHAAEQVLCSIAASLNLLACRYLDEDTSNWKAARLAQGMAAKLSRYARKLGDLPTGELYRVSGED